MIDEITEPEKKVVKKRKIESTQEFDFNILIEELTIPKIRLSIPILTLEIPTLILNINGIKRR